LPEHGHHFQIPSMICRMSIFLRMATISGVVSTRSSFWAIINLQGMGLMMTMTWPVQLVQHNLRDLFKNGSKMSERSDG
jgi:hypothetical protein